MNAGLVSVQYDTYTNGISRKRMTGAIFSTRKLICHRSRKATPFIVDAPRYHLPQIEQLA